MLRRWLTRWALRDVREASADPGVLELDRLARIGRARDRAREAGFERRGWLRAVWRRRCELVEVWDHPEHPVALHLTERSYAFVTGFDNDYHVCTVSLRDLPDSRLSALTLQTTRGCFTRDLAAHLEAVAGAPPWPVPWPVQPIRPVDLDAHARQLRALEEARNDTHDLVVALLPRLPDWFTSRASWPLAVLAGLQGWLHQALVQRADLIAQLCLLVVSLLAFWLLLSVHRARKRRDLLARAARSNGFDSAEEDARAAMARAVAAPLAEDLVPRASRLRCPYCHDDLNGGAEARGCRDCLAVHHGECWSELGGCASCGRAAGAEPVAVGAAAPLKAA